MTTLKRIKNIPPRCLHTMAPGSVCAKWVRIYRYCNTLLWIRTNRAGSYPPHPTPLAPFSEYPPFQILGTFSAALIYKDKTYKHQSLYNTIILCYLSTSLLHVTCILLCHHNTTINYNNTTILCGYYSSTILVLIVKF